MSVRIEKFGDSVIYVALDPNGVWDQSRFPHPLITADYDGDDRLIGISAAGPKAQQLLKSLIEEIGELEGVDEIARDLEDALAEAVK